MANILNGNNKEFNTFHRNCMEIAEKYNRQSTEYVSNHSYRFYTTYLSAKKLINENDKVLSIGAGGAYIEYHLQQQMDVDVTVADFPQAIEEHREFYEENSFNIIECNLLEDEPLETVNSHDIALSCEVIEHIPEPPVNHIKKISDGLAKEGYLLITTPNLSNIRFIGKLLLQQPIYPDPEMQFAPATFENEGVHRRVYVPIEIIKALERSNFHHMETKYTWGNKKIKRWPDLVYPLEHIIPRFRPIMKVIARNQGE